MIALPNQTDAMWDFIADHHNEQTHADAVERLDRVAKLLAKAQFDHAKQIGNAYGIRQAMNATGFDGWPGIDAGAIRGYRAAGATDAFIECVTVFAEAAFWQARAKSVFHSHSLV